MASPEFRTIFIEENLNKQLDQYRKELNKSIRNEVERIIRENDELLAAFASGSASKNIIIKTLMDFAAEPSNIEELADMIGDIATNLTDLQALHSTINTIIQAPQYGAFARNLLGVFRENFGKYTDDNEKFSADELIWEISQTAADYVTELAVDFVWDRVMCDENRDDDDDDM